MKTGLILLLLLLNHSHVAAADQPKSSDLKNNLIDAITVANNRVGSFKDIQAKFSASLLSVGEVCLDNWPSHAKEYAAYEKRVHDEFYKAVWDVIGTPSQLIRPQIYPDAVCAPKGNEIRRRLSEGIDLIHKVQSQLNDRIAKLQTLQSEAFNKFIAYTKVDFRYNIQCLFETLYTNAVIFAFHGAGGASFFRPSGPGQDSDNLFSQSQQDLSSINDALTALESEIQMDLRHFDTIKDNCK